MNKYSNYSIDDLGNLLSDYHKDVHGFRPRYEGLYDDRQRMIEMLEGLDAYMARMHSTPEGREELRSMGWNTSEPDLDRIYWETQANQRNAEEAMWAEQDAYDAEMNSLLAPATVLEQIEEELGR
jgi:hypothetical protein